MAFTSLYDAVLYVLAVVYQTLRAELLSTWYSLPLHPVKLDCGHTVWADGMAACEYGQETDYTHCAKCDAQSVCGHHHTGNRHHNVECLDCGKVIFWDAHEVAKYTSEDGYHKELVFDKRFHFRWGYWLNLRRFAQYAVARFRFPGASWRRVIDEVDYERSHYGRCQPDTLRCPECDTCFWDTPVCPKCHARLTCDRCGQPIQKLFIDQIGVFCSQRCGAEHNDVPYEPEGCEERCSCNGTENVACSYCRVKAQSAEIPF